MHLLFTWAVAGHGQRVSWGFGEWSKTAGILGCSSRFFCLHTVQRPVERGCGWARMRVRGPLEGRNGHIHFRGAAAAAADRACSWAQQCCLRCQPVSVQRSGQPHAPLLAVAAGCLTAASNIHSCTLRYCCVLRAKRIGAAELLPPPFSQLNAASNFCSGDICEMATPGKAGV